jgi:hypothetical protein
MTIQVLAVIGLVLGVALYALLVRRRAAERLDVLTMSRALAHSNAIALERIRNGPRDRAGPVEAIDDRGSELAIVDEQRTETDRRTSKLRWGRGRRSGGNRRRGGRH